MPWHKPEAEARLCALLIGLPNAGKSTLFNRLVQGGRAIEGVEAGLTRDVHEGVALEGEVLLCDTPGLESPKDTSAFLAKTLRKADIFLFVVDGKEAISEASYDWIKRLRRYGVPILLVVNKCDKGMPPEAVWDAHRLGLAHVIPTSTMSGFGLEDLCEAIASFLPDKKSEERGPKNVQDLDDAQDLQTETVFGPLQLALVGRPNVGKSTLFNALVGEERMRVGPEAGVTRDAISVAFRLGSKEALLWDTAGVRRREKGKTSTDQAAESETYRAIRFAHVVVLVIDVTRPLEKGDLLIAGHVIDEGRALVIAMNKSDLINSDQEKEIRLSLPRLLSRVRGVSVVFMSADRGKGMRKLLAEIQSAYEKWKKRVPTSALNRFLQEAVADRPPPLFQRRVVTLKYMTQIKTGPPTFHIFGARLEGVAEAYVAYLTRKLRQTFELEGVPVRIVLKSGRNPYV